MVSGSPWPTATPWSASANLQHPNILPLFDSGGVDGTVFFVMPYLAGESLRARLAREVQLPIEDATRIAGEIAGGLDYATRGSHPTAPASR